ncbi:MAG TPA: hypothetical protein VF610_05260 [Segetibacter sp.]|jgi:hypothetical protein
MNNNENINEVLAELQKVQLTLSVHIDGYSMLRAELSKYLNNLITHNFPLFISILYRLDISEKKLTALLKKSVNEPAGDIVAELIIERQLQKIAARRAFKTKTDNIPDNERW